MILKILLNDQHLIRSFLLVLLLASTLSAHAQQRQVSGTIKDEQGTPLPGVNVVVKGTATGTSSDATGNYTANINPGEDLLVFSFIGYVTQEINVGNATTVDVTMAPDVQTLSEVIVTGYGKERRSDLTGAVAVVDFNKIKDTPRASVLQTLQGRVPGLYVESSGQPSGQTGQILIRGLNTLEITLPCILSTVFRPRRIM